MAVGNTANRSVKVSAGEFAVVKTSENLAYDLTGVTSLTTITNDGSVDPENPEAVSFASNNALTHASYDHDTNHNIIKAAEDGKSITGYYELASTSSPTAANLKVTDIADPEGVVYAAATWQIDFKLSFGPNDKKIGLFIDWAKTGMAIKETLTTDDLGANYFKDVALTQAAPVDGETGKITTAGTYYKAPTATGKGFRIAFRPIGGNSASGVDKVLAKQQTSAKCSYVHEATPSNENYTSAMNTKTLYTGNTLLASDTSEALPTDATYYVTAQGLNQYLGLFPFTANTEVTLSYMCVAWYEGTDENIVNRATDEEYEKITTELAFQAITLKATNE